MAKNNKYTTINFNHIYEKSFTSNHSDTNATRKHPSHPSPAAASYSAASYSAVSSPNKSHGRMLVLTRPTSKPAASQQPPSTTVSQQQKLPLQQLPESPVPQPTRLPLQQQLQSPLPDQPKGEPGLDAISLRPLGRTRTGPLLRSPVLNHDKDQEFAPSQTPPKPDKFIPPHLRPGYVRREEKHVPEPMRHRDADHRDAGHHGGYSDYYGEDVRPKSGGGRMRWGGSSDVGIMARPTSSGGRPRSSGCVKLFRKMLRLRIRTNEMGHDAYYVQQNDTLSQSNSS